MYATHYHDLFYITVKYHQNILVFKLQSGHENVYGRKDGLTNGQTTDGRQAHRYIPRTFRSGDKKLNVRVSGLNLAFSVFLLFYYYFFYFVLFIHLSIVTITSIIFAFLIMISPLLASGVRVGRLQGKGRLCLQQDGVL